MTTVSIDHDTHTMQRVAPVLALVQLQVPDANEAYVLTGAVCVGLNFLWDARYKFTGPDFASPGVGDDTTSVTPSPEDVSRAELLAIRLGVSEALVYSAALCTGLARLQGSTARLTGPFVT